MFAMYMSTCACILGEEIVKYDGETTIFLCEKTVLEFERLSMDDQMVQFGRSIYNSVISLLDQCRHGQKVLTCVLSVLANQCKIGKENLHLYVLKLVEDCAIRRRGAVATVSKFLKIEADRFQKGNMVIAGTSDVAVVDEEAVMEDEEAVVDDGAIKTTRFGRIIRPRKVLSPSWIQNKKKQSKKK
ncbi:hypothetical protein L1887_23847 [Cichorium endivia]|nr:hypothetical protein L1887_23847 [Cichorium endivia]